MNRRRLITVLALVGLLAFPEHALANAGTPLVWAGILHLTVGNFLIGWGEGWLLAWLVARPKRPCVSVMMLANFASAWFGGLLLQTVLQRWLPIDLNNGWRWFWIMVVVTYLVTLVIEWPFVAWCPRWEQRTRQPAAGVRRVSHLHPSSPE